MNNTSLFLVDTVDLTKVELQFVPRELSFSPEAKLEAVLSPGRNNPFYHFSGAEDMLSFQIDWHAAEPSKEDVIRNCRWLESLTKADGYNGGQHPIKIVWGKLFSQDTLYLVKSAKFQVSLFDRVEGILPRQAYQDIVLVRLASYNRTINDVRNNIDLQNTPANI